MLRLNPLTAIAVRCPDPKIQLLERITHRTNILAAGIFLWIIALSPFAQDGLRNNLITIFIPLSNGVYPMSERVAQLKELWLTHAT